MYELSHLVRKENSNQRKLGQTSVVKIDYLWNPVLNSNKLVRYKSVKNFTSNKMIIIKINNYEFEIRFCK